MKRWKHLPLGLLLDVLVDAACLILPGVEPLRCRRHVEGQVLMVGAANRAILGSVYGPVLCEAPRVEAVCMVAAERKWRAAQVGVSKP